MEVFSCHAEEIPQGREPEAPTSKDKPAAQTEQAYKPVEDSHTLPHKTALQGHVEPQDSLSVALKKPETKHT